MFKILRKIINYLFQRDEVCYINSSIFLPEPLSEEEEHEMLLKIEKGDMEARNLLIEHNLRLVVYIAKKFESGKTNLEDLISIGSMGLIKGVETFKLDKNIKLATYASRCIENEILMFLRKISKQKTEVSLDETLNIDADGNELVLADVLGTSATVIYDEVLYKEKEKLMYDAVNALKPREKKIITLRFGLFQTEAMTQKEVAEFLGISQSYISRLEKKIIDKLKDELSRKLAIN